MKNPILVLAEKWRGWSKVQRGLVVVFAGGLCLVVVGNRPSKMTVDEHKAVSAYLPVNDGPEYAQATVSPEESVTIEANQRKPLEHLDAVPAAKKEAIDKDDRTGSPWTTKGLVSDPLIAHTAELAVATKEFSRSRTSL